MTPSHETPSAESVKFLKGCVSAVVFIMLYIPCSYLWFYFLPKHSGLDEAPLTFTLGVFCGIGVVIFAPLSIFLAVQGFKSIRDSL